MLQVWELLNSVTCELHVCYILQYISPLTWWVCFGIALNQVVQHLLMVESVVYLSWDKNVIAQKYFRLEENMYQSRSYLPRR